MAFTALPRPVNPARLGLALLTALLMLASSASAQDRQAPSIVLPELGEPAETSVSPQEEAKLRAEVVTELYGGDYLLEDVEVSDYLNSVGWKLAAKSLGDAPNYLFLIIGDSRINAFAVPGGLIGVNAGLILAASNESELAGVLGHEQAHVTQRHLARTANDTQAANIATYVAMLAAIIAGSANPNAIVGALALGQSINYQRQVNYTRAHEQEADRIGIQTMAAAGYDPEGMATFFSKLEAESRLYGAGLPEILRTHPVNTSRIAEARSRADKLPKASGKEGPEFGFMRVRTEVLMSDRPNEAVESLAAQLKRKPNDAGLRYGYAYALSEIGRANEGLALLAPLLPSYPKQINVQLLQAHLLDDAGQHDAALALLARLLASNPRSAPVVISYAKALLDNGKPEEARNVLLSHDTAYGDRPEIHKVLSDAAKALGNFAESQYQAAIYAVNRGDFRDAIGQLQAALRLSSLSAQDRNRLEAYRDDIVGRTSKRDLAEIERDQRKP